LPTSITIHVVVDTTAGHIARSVIHLHLTGHFILCMRKILVATFCVSVCACLSLWVTIAMK